MKARAKAALYVLIGAKKGRVIGVPGGTGKKRRGAPRKKGKRRAR